ncbi:MAG: hypothetical protein Q8R53_03480 [Nanoarchaeota archaeon]|nr:hypothetical protein [Nanoarchaeota archaeon]
MAVIVDPEYERELKNGRELAEWVRSLDDATTRRIYTIEAELTRDISSAIATVLEQYKAAGRFNFTVYLPESSEPITELKGQRLVFPTRCYAQGSTTVDDPEDITPL